MTQSISVPSYVPRHIRFLGLQQMIRGMWDFKLKLYRVSIGQFPRNEFVDEICTSDQLSQMFQWGTAGRLTQHYSVGFAIMHEGQDVDVLTLCWPENVNQFYQVVRVRPNHAGAWCAAGSLVTCPWDNRISAFETNAWRENVLASPDGPSIDSYLLAKLNQTV